MQDQHPPTDDRERLERYLRWREHAREHTQGRERAERAAARRRRWHGGIVVAAFVVGALGILTWVSHRARETGRPTALASPGTSAESVVTPAPTAPPRLERTTPVQRPAAALPRTTRAAARASRSVAPPDEARPAASADDVRTVAPADEVRPVAPPEPVAPSAAPADRGATSGVAAVGTPPQETPGPEPSTEPVRSSALVARVKAESEEFRAGVKREIEGFRAGIDTMGRGLQWLGGKLRRSE
jgi:cytoskeletal protein RodZ